MGLASSVNTVVTEEWGSYPGDGTLLCDWGPYFVGT